MDFTVGIVFRNLAGPLNFFEFQDSRNFTFFKTSRVMNDTWHLFGWLTLSHVSSREQVKYKSKLAHMVHVPPHDWLEIKSYG